MTGFDPRVDRYTQMHLLSAGESVTGVIVRLPERGAHCGNWLFLRVADGNVVAIHASARGGHTVLERLLAHHARVGYTVTVRYLGKRETADGERTYRLYTTQFGAHHAS